MKRGVPEKETIVTYEKETIFVFQYNKPLSCDLFSTVIKT